MKPGLWAFAFGMLGVPVFAGASETLQCACQQVIMCGADQCDVADMDICPSTDIRLTLDAPAIQLCSFTDCLEGPAHRTDISEAVVMLDGAYSPTLVPEAYPSSVVATIDLDTGIGTVQSSDEQAVTQYSVICQPAE